MHWTLIPSLADNKRIVQEVCFDASKKAENIEHVRKHGSPFRYFECMQEPRSFGFFCKHRIPVWFTGIVFLFSFFLIEHNSQTPRKVPYPRPPKLELKYGSKLKRGHVFYLVMYRL